jgi:hypothetical protein
MENKNKKNIKIGEKNRKKTEKTSYQNSVGVLYYGVY